MIELRKALKAEALVFGEKQTIQGLREGKIKKIFLAKNCPANMMKNLQRYAGLAGAEVIQMQQPSDELAVICKRNHPLTVISC